MIKNLWKCTNFYCSYRHAPEKMILNDGPHSLFYSCPKYYPENREPNEVACPMRLNLYDAEGILETLSEIIEADLENGIEGDYTNLKFTYKKNIIVTVLKYKKNDHVDLDIYNKKAIC